MSSKIEKNQINKLEDEIFNKIGLLLDKPVSPKATKQLLQLINNSSSPKQRILVLVLGKFRGQLILNMIQNYSYLLGEGGKLSSTFQNMQKNIMKYNEDELKQIWKAITKIIYLNQNKTKDQNQATIYRFCYEELLKQGLKVTNLQKKDRLFGLISDNLELFSQLGLKQNIRKVIGTYVEVFRKFPIAVPNYVKVLGQLITLIKQSNSQGNKLQQQEKSLIKLQKLPQINLEYLLQIILQLNNILITTKQKPLHQLHNESLLSLEKILSYKGKDVIKNEQIFTLNKMLQIYLYRKGTRDEARKMSLALSKVEEYLQNLNKEKMIKKYSQSIYSDKSDEKPILIQNVIDKTNQFLAKYQVNNIAGDASNKNSQDIMMRNSRFLKKGGGVGGGKALLQLQSHQVNEIKKNRKEQQAKGKTVKKDKWDLLLESCLQKGQWQKNQKNPFTLQKIVKKQESQKRDSRENNRKEIYIKEDSINKSNEKSRANLQKIMQAENIRNIANNANLIKQNNFTENKPSKQKSLKANNASHLTQSQQRQLWRELQLDEQFYETNFTGNTGQDKAQGKAQDKVPFSRSKAINNNKANSNNKIKRHSSNSSQNPYTHQNYLNESQQSESQYFNDDQQNYYEGTTDDGYENDEEVEEINELIDLAYSYRFKSGH